MKSEKLEETLNEEPDVSPEALEVVGEMRERARYSRLSEKVRESLGERQICSLGCGGKSCKYESAVQWTNEQQAIRGLYSHWVTNEILAMARPNTEQVKSHDIIGQFKRAGIRAIINMQTPGEHALCGAGLESSSGFSYDPHVFMKQGISFYNFPWPDYGISSMSNISSIMHVLQFSLTEGKVAVHCHAGLGRTGVVIACFLVYDNRLSPEQAIRHVRSKRPGSIQTSAQLDSIREFYQFIKPLRIIFSHARENNYAEFSLTQFLARQRNMLHGSEARRLKYLPKLVYVCGERLLYLARRSCDMTEHRERVLLLLQPTLISRSLTSTSLKHSSTSTGLQHSAFINSSTSGSLSRSHSDQGFVSNSSSQHHYPSSVSYTRAPASARSRDELYSDQHTLNHRNIREYGESDSKRDREIDRDGRRDIGEYRERDRDRRKVNYKGNADSWSDDSGLDGSHRVSGGGDNPRYSRYDDERRGHMRRDRVERREGEGGLIEVLRALAANDVSEMYTDGRRDDILREIEDCKRELNTDGAKGWDRLSQSNPPIIAATLLWAWIEDLKEPVLSSQDLPLLLQYIDDPMSGLSVLDKGCQQCLLYLSYVIGCVTLNTSILTRQSIIERMANALTQQPNTSTLPLSVSHRDSPVGGAGSSLTLKGSATMYGSLSLNSSTCSLLYQYLDSLIELCEKEFMCECVRG